MNAFGNHFFIVTSTLKYNNIYSNGEYHWQVTILMTAEKVLNHEIGRS